MGDCKTQTTPTTEKAKGLFGKLKSRKKVEVAEVKAQTFADLVAEAEDKLAHLIVTKQAELQAESGREAYNRKALALLETMAFHLDRVIEAGAEYSDLK